MQIYYYCKTIYSILLHSNSQELLIVQMAKLQTKMETGHWSVMLIQDYGITCLSALKNPMSVATKYNKHLKTYLFKEVYDF